MESGGAQEGRGIEHRGDPGRFAWRLWALVPILLLAGAVAVFSAAGGSLVDLVGTNPPSPDAVDINRVEFKPGEIRIHVRNPQPDPLTIASVTVDDAIVAFDADGPVRLGRLDTTTVVVPFAWIPDDPYLVGITTSTGIETVRAIPAAVATEGPTARGFGGYALIGFVVGVLPVALGLAWLPSLRRADARWLTAFMALTAGLLTFLAVDALSEALELQTALPGALQGPGIILLGIALSYLGLTWIASRFSARRARVNAAAKGQPLSGVALATLVAIGIGLHNLGEGLAIGSSFALGELALGTFLIVGFMIHNVTEGLGIAAPLAGGETVTARRLTALTLIAGAPTIAGAWLGGYVTSDIAAVLFFGVAVGAALQVVVEVGRHLHRRGHGGLTGGWAIAGYLAGLATMYATGLLV